MIGPILQHEDLQRLCRPDTASRPTLATVERWARKIGLRYTYDGKGGLMSTVDAVNAAIGVNPQAAANSEQYRADDVIP